MKTKVYRQEGLLSASKNLGGKKKERKKEGRQKRRGRESGRERGKRKWHTFHSLTGQPRGQERKRGEGERIRGCLLGDGEGDGEKERRKNWQSISLPVIKARLSLVSVHLQSWYASANQ